MSHKNDLFLPPLVNQRLVSAPYIKRALNPKVEFACKLTGRDPFNQNSDRDFWTTSKGGPVFSKLFRLDRTELSFGPEFSEILVEWIAPTFSYGRPKYNSKYALKNQVGQRSNNKKEDKRKRRSPHNRIL